MRTRFQFYPYVFMVALILNIFAFCPDLATAFSVDYDYYVYGYGATSPSTEDVTLTGETTASGSITSTGSKGNYASVQYEANIASGTIKSYAYAKGYDGATATGRVESIGFSDTIVFTIPAGTYGEGITVQLHGSVSGILSATEFAGVKAGYSIGLGGVSHSVSPNDKAIGVDESKTLTINDPFVISLDLADPGTTFDSPTEISQTLTANFNNNETWTTSLMNAQGDYTATAEIDFISTLSLTSLEVPDGVTWTSDSNVFLTAVPNPEERQKPMQWIPLLLENDGN